MNWYYVEAGQQAGPVEEAVLEEMYRSGRIQPDTLVWREGMANWQSYREVKGAVPGVTVTSPALGAGTEIVCSQCGRTFRTDEVRRYGDRYVCATCQPLFGQQLSAGAEVVGTGLTWVSEDAVLVRPYRIEFAGSLDRAWSVFVSNVGLILGSGLFYCAVLIFLGAVLGIASLALFGSVLGPLGGRGGLTSLSWSTLTGPKLIFFGFSMVYWLLLASLQAGYGWFYVNLVRHGTASFGELFAGFRRPFFKLLGCYLLQLLIATALSISFSLAIYAAERALASSLPTRWLVTGVLTLASYAAWVYISLLWTFATLLILDKQYRPWAAMQLSRKMVMRRWWMTFFFLLVTAVIGVGGVLACGIGLFVTVPLLLGMQACLYDDNFRDLAPQP